MDRDKNLLFGVFAVQLRKLTASQIMQAAAAWAADPSKDLSDRLVEAQLITEKDRDLLAGLVDHAVNAHGGDSKAALETFGGEQAACNTLSISFEPPTVTWHQPGETVPTPPEVMAGEPLPKMHELPGRYWLRSEHARGGQGRLLIVHDETLGRDIILKELLAPRDTKNGTPTPIRRSASIVARFLQEAKLTGQLEHPSIVPVYEVGLRPDGTPYYTMKLLKGRTLSEALNRCKDVGERLALLPHLIDVCQGIAYAHSRRVIHRDLKPQNVMVGQFGETVILDWGLAKVRDKPDAQRGALEETVKAMRVGADIEVKKTATGVVLGTPAYMPPEQARGQIDRIDERSDVYSLGAILYQFITGRVPFDSPTAKETIEKVAADESPTDCLAVEPDAPPELAAICRRCMQRDPADRYQTAAEVAEELARFLSGALVAAYGYSFWDLARRYYRRNRPMVNTVAAFLLAIIAGGIYSYVHITLARNEAVRQHARAEDENYVNQMHLIQSYMRQNNYKLARQTLWETNPDLRNWEWGYLLNRCYLDLYTLEDCVRAVYSPDGARIATTSRNKPIEIWNAEDGTKLTEISEETARMLDHQYSPDGTRIAAGGLDKIVRVWNAQTGEVLARMTGHTDNVAFVRFDASGTRVVSAGTDKSIRIWDAATGAPIQAITNVPEGIGAILITSDGRRIVSTGLTHNETGEPTRNDWLTTTWNVDDGNRLYTVTGTYPALSPDSTLLAVADQTDVVIVDAPSGTVRQRLSGHSAFVRSIQFSPDGTQLVSGSDDGTARVFDPASGAALHRLTHGQPIASVAISKNGRNVLTMSLDGTIKIWGHSGFLVNTLEGHEGPVATADFSPDGTRILSASNDQTVRVWQTLASPGQRVVAAYDRRINKMSVSPDGTLVAVVLPNRTMEIRRIMDGAIVSAMAGFALEGGVDAAFSPDGKRIAAALDEFTPIVWDIANQQIISKFTGHQGIVLAVDYSPDGNSVVSASWDNTARIWDAETGAERLALSGHTDSVTDVAYSPDGKLIATASEDGTARLWNGADGRTLFTFDCGGKRVRALAFNADGTLLATGCDLLPAAVWNTRTGRKLRSLEGARNVGALAFTADGTRLATCGFSRGLVLWSTGTGNELVSVVEGVGRLHSVSFAGSTPGLLAALSEAGSVTEFAPAAWQREALERVSSLPEGERVKRLRERPAPRRFPYSSSLVTVAVATTPQHTANALSRLAAAVPESALTKNAVAADGDAYNALARLCIQRGDHVVAVNNVPVRSGAFPEAALRLVEQMAGPSPPEIVIAINRAGVPMQMQCRYVEPVVQSIEKEVDLEFAREYFQLNKRLDPVWRAVGLRTNRLRAAELGEPASNTRSVNGMWVGENSEEDFKKYYLAFGLGDGDRILTLDQKAATDYPMFLRLGDAILATDRKEATTQITLEIERGQFQKIELAVKIH